MITNSSILEGILKHQEKQPGVVPTPRKRFVKRFIKLASGLAVLVVIFGAGVSVGQGRVSFTHQKQVSNNIPANLDYATVEAVYDKIRTGYDGQLDSTALLNGLKEGLAQATGDPYTEYFNPTDASAFNDQLNGTFSGVGAELGKDSDNNIVVIAPLAGYPAEKAGLKAGDIIVAVDGTATSGMTVNDAVTKIRGQEGTKVTIKVVRNKSQEISIEITRAQIKIDSVKWSVTDGIGYMKVSQFSDDTTRLATQAAQEFKQKNVKGVVLDLRSDPGGLLTSAVDVSSLWLSKNQVVLQEKRGGVNLRTYYAISDSPILKGIPTVVLIDGGSASASEITAGALRDNKVATLIGVKSFGKGSVQQLENLGDGSMLKITIAHWFTPSGTGIDKTGINPDQEVKISDEDIKNSTDAQKQAAINFLNK